MIYTKQTKKALELMFKAHKEQIDKGGVPYVFHPYEIASKMDDEKSTIVALLHDVIEDTKFTLDDLKQLGFDDDVIEAIDVLTHKATDGYDEYINKVVQNDLAKKVKIEDLKHNADLSRLNKISDKDIERYQKYTKYIKLLS